MYENIDKTKYSPMIRQYLSIKEKYPDMIVFFRLGDFYEMFFNDAITASKELEIVLTGKDAGVSERVPMCGIPYHAVDGYLDILSNKGYKVVIVEQIEDPKDSKGIVTRDVVRIVTPGTITNDNSLNNKDFNFITSVSNDKERFILAYCDITTGENFLTSFPLNEDLLLSELLKIKTKEVVIGSDFNKNIFRRLNDNLQLTISLEDNTNDIDYLQELSKDLDKLERICFNRLLNYIIATQKKVLVHLQKVNKYDITGFMRIDLASRRNLELTETIRLQTKKNTLFSTLDKCRTAMGSRYLKKNIIFPLVDKDRINKRYDVIKKMQDNFIETDELRCKLEDVYDLERIVGKISYESCNPKDLLQLHRSLSVVPDIINLIDKIKINNVYNLKKDINSYKELYLLLDKSIDPNAPLSSKDPGVIKDGFNLELDELRNINKNGKDFLLNLEAKERERTGIKLLKVGYNRIFGYYFEVPKGSLSLVKDEYGFIRKQTLTTGERFITQELKENENLILRAEEKRARLEYELFVSIRNECKKYTNILQDLALMLASIDMMQSFSKVANENNYCKPIINDEGILDIKNGRHPVIEGNVENFVPNDIKMGKDDTILLITGPNMSGKSTYMRQVALIALMAQIGSYVPATQAKLPIFDAIYTRIGASDDIVSGESTFMVEMNEVNNALSNATSNSLIIFDEIGRGTATYDGMALAQAVIEYIHENIKCKTLFSTHYHELTQLEDSLEHLSNVHVEAALENGEIVFLHKVLKGSVDRSYGINVAKLANIPLEVILRAQDVLSRLEEASKNQKVNLSKSNYNPPLIYDSKTEIETLILKKIKDANIYNMSPIEALQLLDDLQKMIKK